MRMKLKGLLGLLLLLPILSTYADAGMLRCEGSHYAESGYALVD